MPAAGGLGALIGLAAGVAGFVVVAGGGGWPEQAVTSASTRAIISPAAIRLALLAAEVTGRSLAAG